MSNYLGYLPKLSQITELDDALLYTIACDVDDLIRICDHYGIEYPKCPHCHGLCAFAVAEAVYGKARTNYAQ